MRSRGVDSLLLVFPLFNQAEPGLEPLEQELRCPSFPIREFCSPPKSSCLVPPPTPKTLVEKRKWAFSLGQAPSRKHCQDVVGTSLSEVTGEVIYLMYNYVFI